MKPIHILSLALLLAACSPSTDPVDDQIYTLTFENRTHESTDPDNPGTIIDFDWGKFVDYPQYNGPMLYGGKGYSWYDATTDLYSSFPDALGNGNYDGGGIAISDYRSASSTAENGTIGSQLTVYSGKYKNNIHWAICHCVSDQKPPFLEFRYAPAVIESLYICSTTYSYYIAVNGGDGYEPLGEGYVRITVRGIDANGQETGTLTKNLYEANSRITKWTKWDLTSLGEVKRIEFTMSDGHTPMGQPAYFAIDNITIHRY